MYVTTVHRRRRRLVVSAFVATLSMLGSAATAAPGVDPSSVQLELPPGGSTSLTKLVETPVIPPNPDIVLLADTTTSMSASIGNVQSNASSIVSQVQAAAPTAQFAVADYKDVADATGHYLIRQNLTGDPTAIVNGINAWTPLSGGGSDAPEDWIGALGQVPSTISFRPDSTRVVVLFGDSTSHDPSAGFSLGSATAALQAADVMVIAIAVPGADGFLWNGLDSAFQASFVTSQTGGTLASANADQVSQTIIDELQNLPATVTHQTSCDDPSITLGLTPASQTVISGDTVSFDETISLSSDAPQGDTVSCTVEFLVNGELPGPEFVQVVEVDVADITPPDVTVESVVVEATGPDGANATYASSALDNVDGPLPTSCTPPSGSLFPLGVTGTTCTATDAAGNTGVGVGTVTVQDTTPPEVACVEGMNPDGDVPNAHNQDGFFELWAQDVVDLDPDVYVIDTGSGTVFGPYAVGQGIKYTESPGGKPRAKAMDGGIIHIWGKGDMALVATDFSGNASDPHLCLVPPPPA